MVGICWETVIIIIIIVIIAVMEWKQSAATAGERAVKEVIQLTGWFLLDPMITSCPLSGDDCDDHDDHDYDYDDDDDVDHD